MQVRACIYIVASALHPRGCIVSNVQAYECGGPCCVVRPPLVGYVYGQPLCDDFCTAVGEARRAVKLAVKHTCKTPAVQGLL